MGQTRTIKSKHVSKGPNKPGAKSHSRDKSNSASGEVKKSNKKSKSKIALPAPKQQKTRPAVQQKKKQRVYTAAQLGVPQLNSIVPVGIKASRGKKKGKVFVDDAESMMTILAIVNAEKEGQIESKMVKSRQMEEIREARRQEAEKRQESRKEKLNETKESLKKKRKRKGDMKALGESQESSFGDKIPAPRSKSKRVSFA